MFTPTGWLDASAESARTGRFGAPTAAQLRTRRNNTNLFLWTVQGCLAMFYIGTGYAKLSEPLEILAVLMDWPRAARPGVVQALGWLDIAFALGMLIPLVSWRVGRPVLLIAGAAMAVSQLVFLAYYVAGERPSLFAINLALLGATLALLKLRWEWRS